MTEASSPFAGVIVLDPLPSAARAALPADVPQQGQLRQALASLAGALPLDQFDAEEEPRAALNRPRYPQLTGAEIRRRSTVCVAARLEKLVAELDQQTTALLAKIERAKRA